LALMELCASTMRQLLVYMALVGRSAMMLMRQLSACVALMVVTRRLLACVELARIRQPPERGTLVALHGSFLRS
jgi:hypothetical protein